MSKNNSKITRADHVSTDGLTSFLDDWCHDIAQEFHVEANLYRFDDEHALVELAARFGNVRRVLIPYGKKFCSHLGDIAEAFAQEDEEEAKAYAAECLKLPEGSGCKFNYDLDFDSGFCHAELYYEKRRDWRSDVITFGVHRKLRDLGPDGIEGAIADVRRWTADELPIWERTEFITAGADAARELLDALCQRAAARGFEITKISDSGFDDKGMTPEIALRRADGKTHDAFPKLTDDDGAFAELERAIDWFAALDAIDGMRKRAEAAGLGFEVIAAGYDFANSYEPYAVIELVSEDGKTSTHQIDPLDDEDDLTAEIEWVCRGTRRRSELIEAVVAPQHESATVEVSGAMGKLVTHVHRMSEARWHITDPAAIDAILKAGARGETFFVSVTAPNGEIIDEIEQYDAYVYMVDKGEPEPVPASVLREIRPNASPQIHFVDAFDAA